jgi:aminopeptidase N
MNISNQEPLIGDYDVNQSGSKDMYNKGNNLLHTLRQWVNNDEIWRNTLRGLNSQFYHQTVTTDQVEKYISTQTGINLDAFFDQYLRDIRIPVLEYRVKGNTLLYRWTNCIEAFDMQVKVKVDGVETWIKPLTRVQSMQVENEIKQISVDPNFYIYSDEILN